MTRVSDCCGECLHRLNSETPYWAKIAALVSTVVALGILGIGVASITGGLGVIPASPGGIVLTAAGGALFVGTLLALIVRANRKDQTETSQTDNKDDRDSQVDAPLQKKLKELGLTLSVEQESEPNSEACIQKIINLAECDLQHCLPYLKVLFEEGLSLEKAKEQLLVALCEAAKQGDDKLVSFLIERGIFAEERRDPNSKASIQKISYFAKHKPQLCLLYLKVLFEAGLSLENAKEQLLVALCEAAKQGDDELVSFLIERGIFAEEGRDPNSKASIQKISDLAEKVPQLCLPYLKVLFEAGLSLENAKEQLLVALCVAAEQGINALVSYLIERGLSPEEDVGAWDVALLWALKNKQETVIDELLKVGVPPTEQHLERALVLGSVGRVIEFLDNGVRLRTENHLLKLPKDIFVEFFKAKLIQHINQKVFPRAIHPALFLQSHFLEEELPLINNDESLYFIDWAIHWKSADLIELAISNGADLSKSSFIKATEAISENGKTITNYSIPKNETLNAVLQTAISLCKLYA